MPEIELTPRERQALKAQAHGLKPVVLMGSGGLSAAVLMEIDRALAAHELIKVRVPGDDRDEREAMFAEVAESLSAARVQAIGKLLLFYRPAPDEDSEAPAKAPARTAAAPRPRSPKAPSETPSRTRGPVSRTGKPSTPKRSTPDRRDVERVQKVPAARRDPGAAHTARRQNNSPRRGTGRTR